MKSCWLLHKRQDPECCRISLLHSLVPPSKLQHQNLTRRCTKAFETRTWFWDRTIRTEHRGSSKLELGRTDTQIFLVTAMRLAPLMPQVELLFWQASKKEEEMQKWLLQHLVMHRLWKSRILGAQLAEIQFFAQDQASLVHPIATQIIHWLAVPLF